jgi:hypothetical protein
MGKVLGIAEIDFETSWNCLEGERIGLSWPVDCAGDRR